jgi:hypothetical protein
MEVLNINAVVIKSRIIIKSFTFSCNTTYGRKLSCRNKLLVYTLRLNYTLNMLRLVFCIYVC